MKSIALRFFLLLSIFFIGCNGEEGVVKKSLSVTIKNTETYSHSFGVIGLEDSGAITTEPAHAIQSELVINGDGYLVYTYQPEVGYIGKDQAIIEICFSRGDGKCYATEVNTIKFTVTD